MSAMGRGTGIEGAGQCTAAVQNGIRITVYTRSGNFCGLLHSYMPLHLNRVISYMLT